MTTDPALLFPPEFLLTLEDCLRLRIEYLAEYFAPPVDDLTLAQPFRVFLEDMISYLFASMPIY